MPAVFSDPEGLVQIGLYRQVSVAPAGRLVSVAGQVAIDASGTLVGRGDLEAQTEQCYLNVATALASVGAGFEDVVRLTVYFVGVDDDTVPAFAAGVARAGDRLGTDAVSRPPLTGLGVAALAAPEYLVEVEATAVLGPDAVGPA